MMCLGRYVALTASCEGFYEPLALVELIRSGLGAQQSTAWRAAACRNAAATMYARFIDSDGGQDGACG